MEQKLQEQNNVIIQQERLIAEKKSVVHNNQKELKKLGVSIDNQRRKLAHKKEKLASLQEEVTHVTQVTQQLHAHLKKKAQKKVSVRVTSSTVKKQKANPTTNNLNPRVKITHRSETINACIAIHGGTENKIQPVITGMIDTLTSKVKAEDLSLQLLNSKSAVSKSLIERV